MISVHLQKVIQPWVTFKAQQKKKLRSDSSVSKCLNGKKKEKCLLSSVSGESDQPVIDVC